MNVALRWLLIVWVLGTMCGGLIAQPERVNYFPDSGRLYFTQLDPGEEILQRNLLISNQAGAYSVSFSLSFNEEEWNGFALAPRYSSIFSLQGKSGCFIRIRTHLSDTPGGVLEVVYFLVRGKCYSVYWNRELKRWDLVENPCRR